MTLTSANGDHEQPFDTRSQDGESDAPDNCSKSIPRNFRGPDGVAAASSSQNEVAQDEEGSQDSDHREDDAAPLQIGRVRRTQEEVGQLNEEGTLPPSPNAVHHHEKDEPIISPNRPSSRVVLPLLALPSSAS